MIVVVEGPTAAGKTTWCRVHAADVLVPETRSAEPPPGDEPAATFWAARGSDRWQEAVEIEREYGVALCDSDPMKLHYPWSLWRIGVEDGSAFHAQAAAYRAAMADGRIGFADHYLVEVPAVPVLEARRSADPTRRRRNFGLHSRLGVPVREWYELIESLRQGSVRWHFPDDGLASLAGPDRARYDLDAYDALIAAARNAAT